MDPLKPSSTLPPSKMNAYRRVLRASAVQNNAGKAFHRKAGDSNSVWDRRERRKGGDRRHRCSSINTAKTRKNRFDMRSNSGRRKTDRGHPGISIDA